MARKNNSKTKAQRNNLQDNFVESMENKGAAKQWKSKNGRRSNTYSRSGKWGNINPKGNVSIETGSTDNDASWYTPTAQQLKDVAAIPFVARAGFPIIQNPTPSTLSLPQQITEVPGIMVYHIIPMFGDSDNGYEALNIAATAFFNSLRRNVTVSSNYDKNDAMLYLLSMGNLFSFYAWMTRIYGTMNRYDINNVYTPRALVRAMGVDFDDIQTNISGFRSFINNFVYQLQALPIPNVLSYITRQIFLYENIYMDSTSHKGQMYMYNPLGFYVYSEGTEESAAGKLTFTYLPAYAKGQEATNVNLMKLDDIIQYANNLLNPILGSQDFSMYIASDITKAYGIGNMYKLLPLSETFTVTPVYNAEVLSQFENAWIYNVNDCKVELIQNIAINDTNLQANVKLVQYGNNASLFNQSSDVTNLTQMILNAHVDDFSPEQIMVATRLSGCGILSSPSNAQWDGSHGSYTTSFSPLTCGSEIVAYATIYSNSDSVDAGLGLPMPNVIYTDLNLTSVLSGSSAYFDASIIAAYMDRLSLLSKFDWHPQIRFIGYRESTSSGGPTGVYLPSSLSDLMFDIDNYAVIPLDTLKRLNYVAILGEFTSRIELFSKGGSGR